MLINNKAYRIGLTQWKNPRWYPVGHNLKNSLSVYAQHFSSIEGNHSFYGVPSEKSVAHWRDSTPEDFQFCFKFPQSISHKASLQHCTNNVTEFLTRIAPLDKRLGIIWLQLPQVFSPAELPLLARFLENLPDDFDYGVEVRHLDFFAKGNAEQEFNRLLMQHKVNRVMFDTRPLFLNPANDPATQEALQKKPHVPLHVIATADQPMVRFIAPIQTEHAERALDQWVTKFLAWMNAGKTPYIFFHTPDNHAEPQVAQRFAEKLHQARIDLPALTMWSQAEQTSLF